MKYNFYKGCFEDTNDLPQKVAVSGSDGDLTWGELKDLTGKVISIFRQLEIPSGHPVIIYGHKEKLFPVVILACMTLDIPYVPIDHIYPYERIRKIIDITQSQVMFSCSGYLPNVSIPVFINNHLEIISDSEADFSDRIYGNPNDPLRYIMFTSGSTGEPKGVQITREAVISFIEWIQKDYPFSSYDVFMNQSPFTFDVSLYDTLSAFMLGATVLLIDSTLAKDTPRFFQKLKNYRASVWTSTPSFVYMYLREKWFSSENLPDLRIFLFAGEDIPPRTVKTLFEKFRGSDVYNAYGPTEATVTTTWVRLNQDMLDKFMVLPIGYPKRDCRIIIDGKNPGHENPGEIIIVGNHVSTGYFKNEDLNKTKFFTVDNHRAFRTGDLGYYLEDLIFFTGRNDDQIKLNGYRIELGEINAVIRSLPFFDEVVTVPVFKGKEVKRLICFVILKEEMEMPCREIILELVQGKLPAYMLPGEFVARKAFPVSSSHKFDRKQLLEDYLSQFNK